MAAVVAILVSVSVRPARRVLVELDGWETHGTPTARRRDARRDRTAVLAGWTPLRFT